MNNTWGLVFTKINTVENKFEALLSLNTGTEDETRIIFNRIKNEFSENKGDPEVVIDFVDEDDSIVGDFSITKSQAGKIAGLLGHKLSA
ncbi:hypothetical protein F4V43_02220 [Paenibacillus spiritus]|uniref:Uncharacterized protein n=1 Tax=Paenibacillus spiritus TaxID=2496557 RepID=A0A5J5GHZ0_9BACL|nr:hypothetical protein [Paenibacillus spiritus]KAA9007322.1 hypothetical protein F4V43_02220 [Paenibacillus spiritus]